MNLNMLIERARGLVERETEGGGGREAVRVSLLLFQIYFLANHVLLEGNGKV